VQQKREGWSLVTKVFVKQNGNWLLASSQSSRLYEGAIIDEGKYKHFAGQYVSDSGQKLTLTWTGYGFFAHWADIGTSSQLFPVSDTDMATSCAAYTSRSTPPGTLQRRPNSVIGRCHRQ
jgi:hypothetical protein